MSSKFLIQARQGRPPGKTADLAEMHRDRFDAFQFIPFIGITRSLFQIRFLVEEQPNRISDRRLKLIANRDNIRTCDLIAVN
ncbi:MAG: hypothetical protein WBD22_05330, partial [Pyrinomonadaceae bacterium]